MTPDTPTHYGTISRALHWSMAVAIACMYLLALAWHLSGHTETLIPVHKALGTLLLMLVFARILWAIATEQRPRATSSWTVMPSGAIDDCARKPTSRGASMAMARTASREPGATSGVGSPAGSTGTPHTHGNPSPPAITHAFRVTEGEFKYYGPPSAATAESELRSW